VLDFQTQQYKVFPCLAACFACQFVAETLMAQYKVESVEIMKGNTRKLAEVSTDFP